MNSGSMQMQQQMQKWQALVKSEDVDKDEEDGSELDKKIYQAYANGGSLYQAGDFAGAVKAWGEVLDCSPQDPHALWQRGAAKEHLGDANGAIADYSASLSIDSSSSAAGVFFSRASARSDKGDDEGAIDDWSEVVRLEPRWIEAWSCRGTARLGLGDAQGAAADADEALRLDLDSVGAWGLRGAAKQMLEDHAGAAADCRRALTLDPSLIWVKATLDRSCAAAPQATAEEIAPEEPEVIERDVPTEPMPSVERLHELIGGVYARKNPEKLEELPTLLKKYAGREMIMYQFVCTKYGEEAVNFSDSPAPSAAIGDAGYPQPTPGSYPEAASATSGEAASAKAACTQKESPIEEAPEELTHRERGNRLFKQGKLCGAIAAYKESFASAEDGWTLALSNQAICHLKRKEYTEALSIADRCLDQDGLQEVPLKVHLTKFKALAECGRWVDAFATLRKLRARGELPVEVEAAALQEEKAKRRQHAEQVADELSSSDEEDEEEFSGDPSIVSMNLARAVKLALSQEKDLKVNSTCLVGVFGEKPDLVKESLVKCLPETVSTECDVVSVKREEVCQALELRSPDVVVLCRPDLSGLLEDWIQLIQCLVKRDILTVVTGFCDASLVENEDMLSALGCTITSPTIGCFDADAARCDPHPHHHVLAFRGGSCMDSDDLQTLKQGLIDRGFNMPALTGLD